MKALIAFVILGLIVLTLIEVNERIKAKRGEPLKADACPQNKPEQSSCSGCGLADVCEKK